MTIIRIKVKTHNSESQTFYYPMKNHRLLNENLHKVMNSGDIFKETYLQIYMNEPSQFITEISARLSICHVYNVLTRLLTWDVNGDF